MLDNNDCIAPSLIGFDTKRTPLEALQIVREGTTVQYKELIAEDERIDTKLKQMIKASGRNVSSYLTEEAEKSYKPSGRDEVIGEETQSRVLQY